MYKYSFKYFIGIGIFIFFFILTLIDNHIITKRNIEKIL